MNSASKREANFQSESFVYGLPEYQRERIQQARCIANPGCFATAIQLALLPLAHHQSINNSVHINAVTGSTGAGVGLSPTTHFSWRNQNVSWYKPFTHQHLDEIEETLFSKQEARELLFLPQRNFTRGILPLLTLVMRAVFRRYKTCLKTITKTILLHRFPKKRCI